MSATTAAGIRRSPRAFRALVRRDLGVAAPIALTAAALVALAAIVLAGLPLLGDEAMRALAITPSANLRERLALLPDLVRLVLLLVPAWCLVAMTVADAAHRSGALGAAMPVDAGQAVRARALVVVAISAGFVLAFVGFGGVSFGEPVQVAFWSPIGARNVQVGGAGMLLATFLGSVACIAWAPVVGRRLRNLPLACAATVIAATAAIAVGFVATWAAALACGWAIGVVLGLSDLPASYAHVTPLGQIQGQLGWRDGTMLVPGALASAAALGFALSRSWRPRNTRTRRAPLASIGAWFVGVALVAAAVTDLTVIASLVPRGYDVQRARQVLARFREMKALPAPALVERFIAEQPASGTIWLWPPSPWSLGMAADDLARSGDVAVAAMIDAAHARPEELRRAVAVVVDDDRRPLAHRIAAAYWLGPLAGAEFAVRALPRAGDDLERLMLIQVLGEALGTCGRMDWHAVATGRDRLPVLELGEAGKSADGPCAARIRALIMLQLLRWKADGTHAVTLDRRSLGTLHAPTLTADEADAARRTLEQPLTALAGEWRRALDERSRSRAESPSVLRDAATPQPPDTDDQRRQVDCVERPLSSLIDVARSDPSWLPPAPAAK